MKSRGKTTVTMTGPDLSRSFSEGNSFYHFHKELEQSI